MESLVAHLDRHNGHVVVVDFLLAVVVVTVTTCRRARAGVLAIKSRHWCVY